MAIGSSKTAKNGAENSQKCKHVHVHVENTFCKSVVALPAGVKLSRIRSQLTRCQWWIENTIQNSIRYILSPILPFANDLHVR